MDLTLLKKRISSYRTEGGRLTQVPDELAMEILLAWESWSGPATGFYTALAVDFRKVAGILGRAKKLKREGFGVSEFKEVKLLEAPKDWIQTTKGSIELVWDHGRVIRFSNPEQLLAFLKASESLSNTVEQHVPSDLSLNQVA